MDKKAMIYTLLALGLAASNANASNIKDSNITVSMQKRSENITINHIDNKREIQKIMKIAKEIYKLKPDLVIDYDTICKFGGNCTMGTDQYFKDVGFTSIKNPSDAQVVSILI
ncbi:hypothetical protein [Nitrosophilus labii]|uniref:hypothetical protein n=1 Tax=Nitrosophilus labii TaxID=2706014 RepID=UPI001656ABBD|nr:hypothetical protein [Nitrosophilus labii]